MQRIAASFGVWLAIAAFFPATSSYAASHDRDPLFFYDLTPIFKLDLNDPAQRRRFYDETHLVTSLQGLVNRQKPRLFVRHFPAQDDFWWTQMTTNGGWLAGRAVQRITNLQELLGYFQAYYRGSVVWDEHVPATVNLASTLAGAEELVCLRYDPAEGSLFRRLTESGPKLPVKIRLLQPAGNSLFTGKGLIPGTPLPSTGSAKADAYQWLIEHYVKTGKVNPQRMGYYLDAHWLQSWKASGPENHTLANHDYVIAQRGVVFDLNVWDDEACVDDPGQKPGTDVAVLKALLRAAYDRFQGDGVIHVSGFVPWAYKYTDFKSAAWAAGGKHEPVPTEWKYAEILSCFNAYMDADAIGLCAMANASFYQHYPLAKTYPQNPKPTRVNLQARNILDAQGRIAPRTYLAHYVGDYDSAAWLYRELPTMWRDPARGAVPLSWAFNPNLCERFPLGMVWARERRSSNDWFVAGDSGAGYLNPGLLTPPRPHSNLPSGLAVWERHCLAFYRQWDLSLTGFVIDGFGPGLSPEGLDAYARFSPDGIVAQKVPPRGVHNGMPYLRMRTDLDGSPKEVARTLHSMASGLGHRFLVCRSILKRPTWYADVSRELKTLSGDQVQVVDLYTLLWLVREYETNRAHHVTGLADHSGRVQATPARQEGVAPLSLGDGPFQVAQMSGSPAWVVPPHKPGYYLYFDVDDSFAPGTNRANIQLEIEYLDHGQGACLLEYDSQDPQAPHAGAYKPHLVRIQRANTGTWRKAVLSLSDARFAGSQNGEADFRLYNGGDDLIVRSVRVQKLNK